MTVKKYAELNARSAERFATKAIILAEYSPNSTKYPVWKYALLIIQTNRPNV